MSRRRKLAAVAATAGLLLGGRTLVKLGIGRLARMHGGFDGGGHGAGPHGSAPGTMADPAGYDRSARFLGPVYEGIARSIVAEAPAGAAVLDIGCGPGQLAIRVARRAGRADGSGLAVTGTDIDPGMISRAVANAGEAFPPDDPARPAFVVGDVAAMPFPDRAFDLVVSTFSLHHWPDPEPGFAELYRVLRPGGRALIWDVAGALRRHGTGSRGPAELAAGSPFGSMRVGGRWGIGPLVLAERYDLVRPAGPDAEAGEGSPA